VLALWSRITVAAVAVSLALPLQASPPLFLVKQLANWACILLLIVGCAALRSSGNSLRRFRQSSIPHQKTGVTSTAEPSERYTSVGT
jgi:hypothetical protein